MNHLITFVLLRAKFPFLLITLLIHSVTSLIAKPPSQEEAQKACRSDVLSFCKTETIFGPKKKVQVCLRENRDKLSVECKDVLGRGDAFKAEMKMNCGAEISESCDEYEGDRDAMRTCISKNSSKFSPGCREFLKKNK